MFSYLNLTWLQVFFDLNIYMYFSIDSWILHLWTGHLKVVQQYRYLLGYLSWTFFSFFLFSNSLFHCCGCILRRWIPIHVPDTNFSSQKLHLYGFSPVWVRIWLAKVSGQESHFWQTEHCFFHFSLLWTFSICIRKPCETLKLAPHISQVKDLFRWTVLTWRSSWCGVGYDRLQKLQWWSNFASGSPCSLRICLSRVNSLSKDFPHLSQGIFCPCGFFTWCSRSHCSVVRKQHPSYLHLTASEWLNRCFLKSLLAPDL